MFPATLVRRLVNPLLRMKLEASSCNRRPVLSQCFPSELSHMSTSGVNAELVIQYSGGTSRALEHRTVRPDWPDTVLVLIDY